MDRALSRRECYASALSPCSFGEFCAWLGMHAGAAVWARGVRYDSIGQAGFAMKVASGRRFFERYGASARQIAPDIGWALLEPDGSWSEPPDACELIVLAGDAYTRAFVDRV